jgi:hypothetical protein
MIGLFPHHGRAVPARATQKAHAAPDRPVLRAPGMTPVRTNRRPERRHCARFFTALAVTQRDAYRST